MNNIPDKIYLQVDADGERPEDFKECKEVSWCSDRVHKTDIAFYSEKQRDEFALGFAKFLEGFHSTAMNSSGHREYWKEPDNLPSQMKTASQLLSEYKQNT